MKSKSILILAVLVFSLGAKAETITIFDSNATISDGESYDTVVVKGGGTVVDMAGGDVNTVITMNASTFNMSGGSQGAGGYYTWAYDSSILNLSGGTFFRIRGHGQSEIYLFGNVEKKTLKDTSRTGTVRLNRQT